MTTESSAGRGLWFPFWFIGIYENSDAQEISHNGGEKRRPNKVDPFGPTVEFAGEECRRQHLRPFKACNGE
jgi:hypothetical protein